MGDVLKAVQNATGASVDSPGFASERVYVNLGPGRPRDVLASLLNGSSYDYILLGSQRQPTSIARVMLTVRQNSSVQPATPAAMVRPTHPPTPAANKDDSDDSDDTPDREPAAVTQTAPGRTPTATPNTPAVGQQQPQTGQAPFGQQLSQPKTPEQLLHDLQQLQQQQQQQLQLQQQLQQQNNFSH